MKPTDFAAARDRTIRDVLPGPGDPPLRVLFCGINPGLVSAATGHHFARPGNRFWPVLHRAGFTPRRLRPDEQHLLPSLGLGITNIAPRATARADELSSAELVAGGERLRELVRSVRPAALGVVGITAYRVAFASPRATVGLQPVSLGTTMVWVLPNPSGLNAHWSLPAMVAEFARFKVATCCLIRSRHHRASRVASVAMAIDARLDMIGIVVADMATSLAFYRRLGLDIPSDADNAPHVEITLPSGVRLAWDTEDTIRSFAPDWKPGSGTGRTSLAFRFPDPAAVDAAYAELTEAGYHGELPPWDAFWAQRYAVLHDPDGVGVDLFAPLPSASPP